jgi:hypothetical protein
MAKLINNNKEKREATLMLTYQEIGIICNCLLIAGISQSFFRGLKEINETELYDLISKLAKES